MRVTAFVSDPAFIRLLRLADDFKVQVDRVRVWEQLRQSAKQGLGGVAVVDPFWDDITPLTQLALLKREYPTVPIVVYSTPHSRLPAAMAALQKIGIPNYIVVGETDRGRALPRAIAAAVQANVPNQIISVFRPVLDQVPAANQRAALRLLQDSTKAPSVTHLAETCGISVSTFERYCAQADLPEPRRILQGLRCARALYALTQTDMTVEKAGNHVGRSRVTVHRHVRTAFKSTPARTGRALGKALHHKRAEADELGKQLLQWTLDSIPDATT